MFHLFRYLQLLSITFLQSEQLSRFLRRLNNVMNGPSPLADLDFTAPPIEISLRPWHKIGEKAFFGMALNPEFRNNLRDMTHMA